MYGSQRCTAARSGKASVPMVDFAPPRGPSTLSFVPRDCHVAIQLRGQPAVHQRRRAAEMLGQIFPAPGQQAGRIVLRPLNPPRLAVPPGQLVVKRPQHFAGQRQGGVGRDAVVVERSREN